MFRFLCSECVDEMHGLGWMVKMAAPDLHVRWIAQMYR